MTGTILARSGIVVSVIRCMISTSVGTKSGRSGGISPLLDKNSDQRFLTVWSALTIAAIWYILNTVYGRDTSASWLV